MIPILSVRGLTKVFEIPKREPITAVSNVTFDLAAGTALGVVGSICYLLPIGTILVIVGLTVSFHIFRAIVAFVKTIWDLLPIV